MWEQQELVDKERQLFNIDTNLDDVPDLSFEDLNYL